MPDQFDIKNATRKSYDLFNQIRDKNVTEFPSGVRFWDIVVLTASDNDQKQAYNSQIASKLRRHEIPTGVAYHVFADPPGPRIGCGGATMRAIAELRFIYGVSELEKKYVLLINAGGLSQRLPSSSVLGKVFAPLPISGGSEGRTNWQVLELKLACYLPLLARMKPGYLHVPSDTIEVFDLGSQEDDDVTSKEAGEWTDWNFSRPGLTALAHPSSLEIGCSHGVFVLSDTSSRLTEFRDCKKVLQKPTEEEILTNLAVISKTEESADVIGLARQFKEYVYTDSLFYFDHTFAAQLNVFYELASPLRCELDAYGDFMRSLGPNADSAFTNVSDPVVSETKLQLFRHLQSSGAELRVIAMNASKFYHLGTMSEYTENLCENSELAAFVGFESLVFSAIKNSSDGKLSRVADFPGENRRLIHSVITESTTIDRECIVEYCRFVNTGGVKIAKNCIVSNCHCDSEEQAMLCIPSHTFLCTIPVKVPEVSETGYVTLMFGTDDDIKKVGSAESLKYHGASLCERARALKLAKVFPASPGEKESAAVGSLWDARIFPLKSTMDESFRAAVCVANGEVPDGMDEVGTRWLSAADAMSWKDVQAMLQYRDNLAATIRLAFGQL